MSEQNGPMRVTDDLIVRLEHSDADWLAQSVHAARGDVLRLGNAVAANCGDGNVLTQVVGLLHRASDEDWVALFTHFAGRCGTFEFKLSPIADPDTCRRVATRAVDVHEFESLLIRDLSVLPSLQEGVTIERVGHEALLDMVRRSVDWFYPGDRPPGFVETISRSLALPISHTYAVIVDGVPVGGASLTISHGVAWFHGGAVDPSHRGRGYHKALIAHRLHEARRLGASIAAQGASPGTVSQQNAQQNGFAVAYTRPSLLLRAG